MVIQLSGWLAFTLGPIGTWLIPRNRHGWLLTIAAAAVWAAVDIDIRLWPGLAGAAVAVILNTRCWQHNVTSTQPSEETTP